MLQSTITAHENVAEALAEPRRHLRARGRVIGQALSGSATNRAIA